jgi:biotin carboxyl carrier protein
MKFAVTVGGSRHEVLFDEAYGVRKLELDGQTLALSLLRIDGCRVRFTVDGRPVEALVTGKLPELLVDAGAGPVAVVVEESRFAEVRRISGMPRGPRELTDLRAPMPGLVTRVLVSAGDLVSVGTPLVVMEAMKMENELRSPAEARVTGIHARPGGAVEVGALLVSFEPVGPAPAEDVE